MKMKSALIAISALLVTSCQFWNVPVREYFEEYTRTAVIEKYLPIAEGQQADGAIQIPSDKDVTVTFHLHNPQNFKFVAGNNMSLQLAGFDAAKALAASGLPADTASVKITQDPSNASILHLTYPAAFLQAADTGFDISPSVQLEHPFSHVDFGTYSKLKLLCNTAPPAFRSASLAQTKDASPRYVICLRSPDMGKKLRTALIHRDVNAITVNGKKYPLNINAAGTDFEQPAKPFLARNEVTSLLVAGVTPESIPTGSWLLFFDTGIEIAANGQKAVPFTFALNDAAGLSSVEYKTSTNPKKPEPVKITLDESTGSLDGGADLNAENEESHPHVIKIAAAKTAVILRASSATAGASVHVKVTDSASGVQTEASGNPAEFSLGLAESEEEKLYRIEAFARADGYENAATKIFYYKVSHGLSATVEIDGSEPYAWARLKKAVKDAAAHTGITIRGTIQATADTAAVTGVGEDNFGDIVINKPLTISAKDAAVLDANKAVGGKAAHRIFTVQAGGALTAENLTLTGGSARDGGAALIERGGRMALKGGIIRANEAAQNGGAIAIVGGSCVLSGTEISGNTAVGNGSGVFLAKDASGGAGSLTVTGESRIGSGGVPSDSAYLQKDLAITASALRGGAHINVEPADFGYAAQNSVPLVKGAGAETYKSYFSLSGTPEGEAWSLVPNSADNALVLKKADAIIKEGNGAWARLKQAVAAAEDGAVIFIEGVIRADASSPDNYGEIVISKKLTIQAIHQKTVHALDANKAALGSSAHRIFTVKTGAALTLNGVALKNGKAAGSGAAGQGGAAYIEKNARFTQNGGLAQDCEAADSGGAFFAHGGSLILNSMAVKGNKAGRDGGAVFADADGAVKARIRIEGGAVVGGEAAADANFAQANGGAVALSGEGNTLSLDGAALSGNKAGRDGGAVFASGGTVTVTRGSLSKNSAQANGGAVALSGEGSGLSLDSVTLAENKAESGGALFASGKAAVTVRSGSLNKNEAAASGGAVAFSGEGGSLTLDGVSLTGNKAGNGGAVFSGSAKVKIRGGSLSENEAKASGGAISAASASGDAVPFEITGGAVFASNRAKTGGALSISGSILFSMTGGRIEKNSAESGSALRVSGAGATLTAVQVKENAGSALVADGKTLSLTDTIIEKNDGFGIDVRSGTVSMSGGAIKENKNSGVCIGGGEFTLKTGEIRGNAGRGNGGGVYISGSDPAKRAAFIMEGGRIEGNKAAKTADAAGSGGGVYLAGGAFIMKGGVIAGNEAAKTAGAYSGTGGGVCVERGDFEMSGGAKVEPSAAPNEHTRGANDVYLKTGSLITVTGALTEMTAARITPEAYTAGTAVVQGGTFALSAEYAQKFAVTKQGSDTYWMLKQTGNALTLQRPNAPIDGNKGGTWKMLKDAVADAADGDEIIVKGELKATAAAGDNGAIVVTKQISIAGEGAGAVLNANGVTGGKPAHRIFTVKTGAKLMLKNVALKGGVADGGAEADKRGGGILVDGGALSLNGAKIEGSKAASSGGGIFVGEGGSVSMDGGEISGNAAGVSGGAVQIARGSFALKTGEIRANTATQSGGAVFVDALGSFEMAGGSIKDNTTVKAGAVIGKGAGIYVTGSASAKGSATVKGGRIENNKAGLEGGVCKGLGGAVYVDGGSFRMTSAATAVPSAAPDAETVGFNDVYLKTGSVIEYERSVPRTDALARLTPESFVSGTPLVKGSGSYELEAADAARFTVTEDAGDAWTLKHSPHARALILKVGVIDGAKPLAWKKLKAAVDTAEAGDTIFVRGTIQATNDAGNFGQILITKKISIDAGGPAVLDANGESGGKAAHRIFSVTGAELTLKNLTLKGGKAAGAGEDGNGGAIAVSGGTVNMRFCNLTGNEASENGGALYAKKNGGTVSTVTISGGIIGGATAADANKAIGTGSISGGGNGGGIFVNEDCTLNLVDGVQVIGNIAAAGGAIFANAATVELTNCTLKGNSAKIGGAIYAQKYSSGAASVTISGGVIGGTTATDANKASGTGANEGMGGAIYVSTTSTLTLKDNAQVIGNTAKNGGGVFVSGATANITGCTLTGNEAKSGGAIYAQKGDGSPSTPSTVTISGGIIGGATAADANKATGTGANEGMGGGIYISDTCALTLKDNAQVIGNTAKNGGGAYMQNASARFTMSGAAVVAPSTGADANGAGKNDVYLDSGAKITLPAALTGAAPVARITVADDKYLSSTQVLDGSKVNAEHAKFAVTPKDSDVWGVNEQGNLALMQTTIDATALPSGGAWKKLKEAVAAAGNGSVILVKGEVKATGDSGNSGELVVNRSITVKLADGATTAVLNANKDGANAPAATHRIFKVASGKTLTLENLTLTGGKPDGSDEGGNGGCILLQGGALNMKSCDVKGNEAAGAGGGIYAEKVGNTASSVTISGGAIGGAGADKNKTAYGSGGGIHIDTGCSLTMKDNAKVTGNESATSGGGIHAENGSTLVIEHCSVTANTASGSGGGIHAGGALTADSCAITDNKTTGDSGGGACVSGTAEIKGSTTIAHNKADVFGGGIYVSSGTLTISNATIGGEQDYDDTDPNKANGNKAVTGGGIYAINSTLTMTDCMLPHNAAMGSSSVFGGGIYAEGGEIDMTRCQLSANKSKGGGGMYAKNTTLTMTTCQLDDNDAGSGSGGGAYAEGGSFALSGSTMSGNATGDSGGGAYIKDCAFTMTDSTLTGNTAQYNGGGAYVAGGSFTMKGSSRIIPSSAGEENQPGKNEVYLDNGAKITLPAVLTGTGTAARITVAHNKYLSTTQVLDGSKVVTEYGKFTVTPKSLGGGSTQVWTINNTGHLQKPPVTINGADSDAWKKLKAAVAAADDGDIFIINGEVKATNATDNSGELEVNKDITVKKADGATSAVLNANSNHSGTAPADAPAAKHRIFKVTSGKTLTLQNLTLKGGVAEGTGDAEHGGAIFAQGATVNMISCTLIGNEAGDGGAIYVDDGCTLTMRNNVQVIGNSAVFGGGVYAGGATVNITNCTLKGNKAPLGGALYAEKNGSTPANVTIEGGVIGGATAAEANKATNGGGDGGGIYISDTCTLTLKDNAQVIGNTAKNGGGVYAKGGTVKITGCTIAGNEAKSGGAIYAVKKDSTPANVTIEGGTIGGTNPAEPNTAIANGNGGGGGIYIGTNCALTLKDGAKVIGNSAKANGGGIYTAGAGSEVRIAGGEVSGNAANQGGGIYIGEGGKLYVNIDASGNPDGTSAQTVLENNHTDRRTSAQAYASGGAIFCEKGIDLKLHNTKISDCGPIVTTANAKAYGAGLALSGGGTATLTAVEISGCKFEKTGSGSYQEHYAGAIYIGLDPAAGITTTVTLGQSGGYPCNIHDNEGGETGGGIVNNGTLTINGGFITNNKAGNGGGISGDNGSVTITGCTISGNEAESGGGVRIKGGRLAMTSCTVKGNTGNNGGAIFAKKAGNSAPAVTISGGAIGGTTAADANKATGTAAYAGKGGGIYVGEDCTLTMRNNVAFIGNDAANEGGGVYAKGGTVDITNCTLKGNKAKNGGGVYAEKFKTRPGVTPPRESPSTVTIKGGVIGGTDAADANKATGTGTDGGGGGIYIGEDCTLTMQDNAKIIGNAAAQSGGAIFAAGATVNLTLCSLTGNKAEENGGAIYAIKETVASTVTITGGAIGGMDAGEANVVTNDYGFGGGIYINTGCTLTLNEYVSGGSRQGVQISGNKAWRGGGVRANDSTVSMTGSTIRGNRAKGSVDAGGGGVYIFEGSLDMTRCALTGNTAATNGGGVNIEKGSATLTRCTFTGNEAKGNGGAIYTKKIDGVASTVTIKGGAIGGAAATDANKATGSGAGKGMGGGIYVGDGCSVMLEDSAGSGAQGVRISGNQAAASGGGAYVENSSATFAINGSSTVTPPTDDNANKAGKNDVYLNSGAMITVAGALTPAGGIAARITVPNDKYLTGTQVLTGGAVSAEYVKFAVTPKGSEYWTVKNDGYLTK